MESPKMIASANDFAWLGPSHVSIEYVAFTTLTKVEQILNATMYLGARRAPHCSCILVLIAALCQPRKNGTKRGTGDESGPKITPYIAASTHGIS